MGAKELMRIPHQGLKPASTGKETADQVVWLEGPERGRRMPNIKVNLKEEEKDTIKFVFNILIAIPRCSVGAAMQT